MSQTLKTYLTISVVIISIISSVGVYGFLSSGYQSTGIQYENILQEIEYHEFRLSQYENEREEISNELLNIDRDISTLRGALASNIIQYTDTLGNVITTTSRINREAYQEQLRIAQDYRNTQTEQLRVVRDSIRSINNQILTINQSTDISRELGPLIYLSNLFNRPMDVVVNWLMLAIIFVFDPLALSLIMVAIFTWKQATPPQEVISVYSNPKPEPLKPKEKKPPTPPHGRVIRENPRNPGGSPKKGDPPPPKAKKPFHGKIYN